MANPFAHVELNTDDPKKAEKFYKAVFAWKTRVMPGPMPYTMIDVGGGTGGGMQKKPMPEAPNVWLAYVQVDDANQTLAKATSAGGTVIMPYTPIGDMGAIAIFSDPSGAGLGLWEASPNAAPPPPAAAKAPAKKAPAKKAPAKKAPAKKAPAKKAPAKKAPAKKAPAKKAAKKK